MERGDDCGGANGGTSGRGAGGGIGNPPPADLAAGIKELTK